MSRKVLKGTIVSNKMKKTVVVLVERKFSHPVYHKVVTTRKKYYAHCEREYPLGKEVLLEESRPLSKLKRWRVVEKAGEKKPAKKKDDSKNNNS